MESQPTLTSSNQAQDEVSTLRHQLNSTLMLLLAVSVIVTWYFAYQFYFFLDDSRKGADTIETLGPRIVEFNRVNEPQFQQTAAKLREYARTHPDIVPILAKYGVVQVSNVAPAAATAPKQ